jgi:NRAMP (natural resistance-associated macrophage protein)-like metal ion transporter
VARRRHLLLRGGALTTLLAVVGPGVLSGLSDDDPAGITTYSILGAEYGYQLIWVLVLSTAALIIFHQMAVRVGVVSGKGLMVLIREHWGLRVARIVLCALVIANVGTICAEFAGVAAASDLFGFNRPYLVVPIVAVGVSLLVLKGSFRRVEHVLLAISAVFVTYVISGLLAGPDWAKAAKGTVIPSMPFNRDAILIAVATVGTTLAPWGLTFIQSYAVDKQLKVNDLKYERIDVAVGAVLTGIIGFFIVVACAATIHASGNSIEAAGDAARALEPLAGGLASRLFAFGFLGAALLAVAIVPLATAYSTSETFGRKRDLNDGFKEARLFYLTYMVTVAVAALIVLIPGAPLIPILFLSQALNAVLLLAVLPFLWSLSQSRVVMGEHVVRGPERMVSAAALAVIALAILALAMLNFI